MKRCFLKQAFLGIIFMIFSLTLFSQTWTFSGQVINELTAEPISFCNVFFKGSNIGTFTDENGFFEFSSPVLHDSLYVTYIGFQDKGIKTNEDLLQHINFSLKSSSVLLMTAVVNAGENPAHPIMRKVIANKPKNKLENLGSYNCNEYAKVEIDLEGIERSINSKLLKSFDYIFEHIDSSSEDQAFLPVYFTETISNISYESSTKKTSKTYLANKATGLENQSVIQFVNDFQEDYNVYENWIDVFGKPFAGPFADKAFGYYEFYLIDSIQVNKEKFYQIKFKPKRKQECTFFGHCWIHADSYAVQDIDMSMSEEVNINFVQKVSIHHEFKKFMDIWIPIKQETKVHVKPLNKVPGMIGRKTSYFYDHLVLPSGKDLFNESQLVSEGLLDKDENYWETERPEQLSKKEQAIYTMVDSMVNIKQYKTISEIIKVAAVGTKEIGPLEVGPYFSLTSNNILEGQRFKFGAWTSSKFSQKVRFGGFAAYGMRDKRFKYGADFKWIINKEPRMLLGASYKNDNDLNTDNDFEVGEGNMLASFFRRDITQKLILDKKTQVYFERYWDTGFYTRILLMHYDRDPVGNLMPNGTGFNFAYQANGNVDAVADTTITSAEIKFKLKYTYKEKFLDTGFSRRSIGSKYPSIGIEYSLGKKGILGSAYDYHKLYLDISHTARLNPIGEMSVLMEAGKTFGQVPFLLSNVHRGNETFFLMNSAFNGMNRYEFVSDQFVSLKLEHHFDGFILNKIPLLRKLNWRSVASFKAVYGSMSTENKAANDLNMFNPNNDKFVGIRAPSSVPYMETGIGVENILKIFRVDALWRLNYLDNPETIPFAVKVGVDMRF